jgi:glycosyltransferase involved in cell wall biosynthesis
VISLVIPVIDEATRLPNFLRRLADETTAHDVIVVDGGSADDSVAIAITAGVRVLETAAGRGIQLYAGADQAMGDVMLFLHADSAFPAGGLAAIDAVLAASLVLVGGNFGSFSTAKTGSVAG